MQEVRQETKKNKRRISKPVGIALFYIVCAATAAMVILHNNPLADKPTEDLMCMRAAFAGMHYFWYLL